MSAELELAGWRRTVSELYAAVRAEDDPQRGHERWRRGRDELFRSHPQSPLPAGDPLRVTGLPYWPYDPELRFELPLLPAHDEVLSVAASDRTIPRAVTATSGYARSLRPGTPSASRSAPASGWYLELYLVRLAWPEYRAI